jgi:glycosyltransferase involved in cell wall biosynthesis
MTNLAKLPETCRCGNLFSDETKNHFEAIIPMYNSQEHIPDLIAYLDVLADSIMGKLNVVFVVDGNVDNTTGELVSSLRETSQWNWKILQLSRNFGVGPSLMAAFKVSTSCVTVAFGCDLQEPVELFARFQKVLNDKHLHLALGVRKTRQDPLITKFFSNIYWRLYVKFISPDTPRGGFDVCGLSYFAKTVLVEMKEQNTNVTAQIDWIGLKREYIQFDRQRRSFGKSKWTFRRKLRLFFDSFYGFTDFPIRIMQIFSFVGMILLSGLGLITVISWAFGLINIPGYTTLVFIQIFTANLTIFTISILSGYVVRTFDNSKFRPNYIVERVIDSN